MDSRIKEWEDFLSETRRGSNKSQHATFDMIDKIMTDARIRCILVQSQKHDAIHIIVGRDASKEIFNRVYDSLSKNRISMHQKNPSIAVVGESSIFTREEYDRIACPLRWSLREYK